MRPSLLLLLALTLACQSKPASETAATKTDSVNVDLARKAAADAPRTAADRLIRMLYYEHDKKENPFHKAPDRTLIDQFFTKEIGDKVWQRAQKTAKRPIINPLYNVPDAGIRKMWVLPATISGSKASVFVTYTNNNVLAELRLDMALQPSGRWRIANIHYADGTTLLNSL